MLNVTPDPMTQNVVYGHTTKVDTDPKKTMRRSFIIFGYQNTITAVADDLIKYQMEVQPLLKRIDDGVDYPATDPSELSDEQHEEVLVKSREWFIQQGFDVGELETKTMEEWVQEAGWAECYTWPEVDSEADSIEIE